MAEWLGSIGFPFVHGSVVPLVLYSSSKVTNPLTRINFLMLHVWRVGSTFLTLSITLERYCAICHPLSRVVNQTYLLASSLILALVYNIPKYFEMELIYLPDGDIGTIDSEMRKNRYKRCSEVLNELGTRSLNYGVQSTSGTTTERSLVLLKKNMA